ncbi:MAG: AAA family ATPase [Candidatus Thiodiazotropha sp.]
MHAKDYYGHPIFYPVEFRLITPAIKQLQNVLTRLVWTGATGASLLGFTRAGKTTAIELISDKIKSRSGNKIPVLRYSAHQRDQHTIRSLYVNLLTHLDLPYRTREKTEILIDKLLMFIAETAKKHQVKQVIMAVDEAQRLAIPQIDVFAELDDRLRKEYSVSLMCLFIGNQEQMGRLLDAVHEGRNEHIEGRFFRQSFRFGGLRSKADVSYCLKQYDQLRYPYDGPTYTEYFIPSDYGNGFRLTTLAGSIWSGFRRYHKTLGAKEWAMEYFVRTVNLLLTDYLTKYGAANYSDDMISECINVSGLIPELELRE